MIHLFKVGGDWKTEQGDFDVICIPAYDKEFYIEEGYRESMEDALSLVSEGSKDGGDDDEQLKESLRKEIEGITGEAPHWKCSLETLQSKLSELKDGTGNN